MLLEDWRKLQWNFTENSNILIKKLENRFENILCKMSILSRSQGDNFFACNSGDYYSLELAWLILIPTWISNYIHYKVWDEIILPFSNFIGATE